MECVQTASRKSDREEERTGWPASFQPFAFWASCFPCVMGIENIFFLGIVVWSPKPLCFFFPQFWVPFDDFLRLNSRFFHITHRRKHHAQDTKSEHHCIICLKSQVLGNDPFRTGTVRHGKDGRRRHGQRRWRPHWACRIRQRCGSDGEMMSRNVGLGDHVARRLFCPTSLELCVICTFVQWVP